jgi:hypothetical protein
MLRITDKGFQYTPSFSTDLKKRFAKLIREQKAAAAEQQARAAQPSTVTTMKRAAKNG